MGFAVSPGMVGFTTFSHLRRTVQLREFPLYYAARVLRLFLLSAMGYTVFRGGCRLYFGITRPFTIDTSIALCSMDL
jgi:hypothetical protein